MASGDDLTLVERKPCTNAKSQSEEGRGPYAHSLLRLPSQSTRIGILHTAWYIWQTNA